MKGDLHGNLYSSPEDGGKKKIMLDLRGLERRRDDTKEEENVLQNMHQLQEVGEHTFVDQSRLPV